jgi:hypothetical protein
MVSAGRLVLCLYSRKVKSRDDNATITNTTTNTNTNTMQG